MRASRQGQPCSCLFFKTHQIGLLLCFSVQSRKRPETWTRTRKAVSRRSVTVDFLCVCTLFGFHLFFTRRRWRVVPPLPEEPEEPEKLFVPGASLVTVDVLTGHICSVSLCLYVPTERDKYVWLVQSRRHPEKWTRTQKAGSRGSATPDPVS